MYRVSVITLLVAALVVSSVLIACGPKEVTFPDSNLEVAIREVINKPEGVILTSDLEGLTSLKVSGNEITDLTGLEHCTNLTQLQLWGNQISDISPLASMTNLTNLWLLDNQISDISPLASLTNLTNLYLAANQISDISPLASLTDLTQLTLFINQITDISPLIANSGLSAGDTVNLGGNPMSDTSVNVYIPQLEERGVVVGW